MIKRLICFLWGHDTVRSVSTGETFVATNLLGMKVIGEYEKIVRYPFCMRCAKDVPRCGKESRS